MHGRLESSPLLDHHRADGGGALACTKPVDLTRGLRAICTSVTKPGRHLAILHRNPNYSYRPGSITDALQPIVHCLDKCMSYLQTAIKDNTTRLTGSLSDPNLKSAVSATSTVLKTYPARNAV